MLSRSGQGGVIFDRGKESLWKAVILKKFPLNQSILDESEHGRGWTGRLARFNVGKKHPGHQFGLNGHHINLRDKVHHALRVRQL